MQYQEKIRALKWSMLCRIADMCITTEELLPGRENYQLRLNARRVGDEVRVFFYAMGDSSGDDGVTAYHSFKVSERKMEKDLRAMVLVLLPVVVALLGIAVWFHFR